MAGGVADEPSPGWQHPEPAHICDLPGPEEIPREAVRGRSAWVCSCGIRFVYDGIEQPYSMWIKPRTTPHAGLETSAQSIVR